jgi:2-oxoisovalerate dehydrogenase E2 component (dihydrolipoyl transacylase)
LIDIDIEGEVPVKTSIDQEAETLLAQDIQRTTQPIDLQNFGNIASEPISSVSTALDARQAEPKKGADIATPAVRHMLKQLELDIREINGTGKDGRVRKEDIDRYRSEEGTRAAELNPETSLRAPPAPQTAVQDRIVTLTHKENQMLKVMTQSLSIPHFLYTHPVDLTLLNTLRTKSNSSKSLFTTPSSASASNTKLTALPFIMKAISQALAEFPKVNAHLDVSTNPKKPQLILKASHSFGLAIDTPQGLVVPVVRNVQEHSITSLMTEINRIGALANAGKLAPEDFKGATLSISNIGSIGGGVVSPVIVPPMVAIIGIGRTRTVPAFRTDLEGKEVLFKKEEVQLSWSADHRVLDGATVARCAERVGAMLENIDLLGLALK